MRFWGKLRDENIEGNGVMSAEEFDDVLEKRALQMLGMDLREFRLRAVEGELPETPAVDHLRFLLGV